MNGNDIDFEHMGFTYDGDYNSIALGCSAHRLDMKEVFWDMSSTVGLLVLTTSVIGLHYLVGGGISRLASVAALARLAFDIWENGNTLFNVGVLVNGILVYSWIRLQFVKNEAPIEPEPTSKSILTAGPLRPLIFPCKTTHTRLFPKKHSFGYSYLQVGVPIGWKGDHSSVLGIERPGQARAWFSVNAADYLARGQAHLNFEDKLQAYLTSQGESLADYAHAYLLTAPRFLGYSFNPVSFWYLFSKDLRLQAMILEVNNTFDERRMYFMKRGVDLESDPTTEETRFTHTWAKDFHVSPFNSRKGDYSLAAINPLTQPTQTQEIKIDNVITLKSSKGHSKLIARIISTTPAVDPASMSFLDVTRLITAWFWVGFLTFPRILKEAGKLFFTRKLHVWYRPEVIKSSIGRSHTQRENVVAAVFLSFLKDQVQKSTRVSSLEYTPPNGSHLDTLILQSGDAEKGDIELPDSRGAKQNLKLQILTPQYYTDIVTASSPAAYILAAEKQALEARTFSTTSYTLLAELLRSQEHTTTRSIRERCLALLSQSADPQARALDTFATKHLDSQDQKSYFQAATALVLARRLLAGFDVILDIASALLQAGLAFAIAGKYVTAFSS